MEIVKKRDHKTDHTTIGGVLIDGEFFCYGLEPTDRNLNSDMTLEQIAEIKVPGATAVPAGRYPVIRYYSPKHETNVPRIINIPGFDFVEIHAGNTAADTEGCLLLGNEMAVDLVLQSRDAISAFYDRFFAVIDTGGEVWITFEEPVAGS